MRAGLRGVVYLSIGALFSACAAHARGVPNGRDDGGSLDDAVSIATDALSPDGARPDTMSSVDARDAGVTTTDSGIASDAGVVASDAGVAHDSSTTGDARRDAPRTTGDTLEEVQGNGQFLSEFFPTLYPLKVRLLDSSGNPRAGVPVRWESVEGATAAAGLHTSCASSTTDADGIASCGVVGGGIYSGNSWEVTHFIASIESGATVEFTITTTENGPSIPTPPSAIVLEPESRSFPDMRVGDVIRSAIRVQVGAQTGSMAGRGIPNIAVRITNGALEPSYVRCGGERGYVLTDSTGIATCDLNAVAVGSSELRIWVGYGIYHPLSVAVR